MLYLYIGWRSRVKDSKGFFVADQGVPAIANGAATAADWMSAASFISMAGLISFMGYLSSAIHPVAKGDGMNRGQGLIVLNLIREEKKNSFHIPI